MVVFKESVRYFSEEQVVADEEDLVQNAASWGQCDDVEGNPWSESFTIIKQSLMVFKLTGENDGAGDAGMYLRLTYGGTNYAIAGSSEDVGDHPPAVYGITLLAAGTYTVQLYGYNLQNATCKVGITNFSDLVGETLDRECNNISNTTWTTIIDEDVVGLIRETCLGTLKRHVVRLNVCITTGTNDLDVNYLNRGESHASGISVRE